MILLRPEVGFEWGAGHFFRCLSLAEALERKGQAAALVVEKLPDSLKLFLGSIACLEQADFLHLPETFTSHLKMLIVDSYVLERSHYEALRAQLKVPLYAIDDAGEKIGFAIEGVLNFGWSADPTRYPSDLRRMSAIGTEFSPLRAELLEQPVQERSFEEVRRIFVSMGGSDPHGQLVRVVELALKESNADLDVIVGPLSKQLTVLETMRVSQPRLHLHASASAREMASLMQQADLAITAGGTTCSELAYFGCPMLAVAHVPNHGPILAGIERHHAGWTLPLGWGDDAFVRLLREATEKGQLRKMFSEKGRTLFDGRGADRLAEFLVKQL